VILVLIFGSGLAWAVHRVQVKLEALAAVEKAGGQIKLDWEWIDGRSVPKGNAWCPEWLINCLGDHYFVNAARVDFYASGSDSDLVQVRHLSRLEVLSLTRSFVTDSGLTDLAGLSSLESLYLDDTAVTDSGLVHLKRLISLKSLWLNGTAVSDSGLTHLKGMTHLEDLNLDDTVVTDAGLAHLEGMSGMQWLHLGGTKISDAGLVHLKGMTKLRNLLLSDTKVSDAGLVELRALSSLQWLWLDGTEVSDAGLQELRTAMPKVGIVRKSLYVPRKRTRIVPDAPPRVGMSNLSTPAPEVFPSQCHWFGATGEP
jgi:hypothetical protein